ATEHIRERGNGGIRALEDLDVRAVDAGSVHINDDFPRPSRRVGQVAVAQDIGAAVAIHDDGLHDMFSQVGSEVAGSLPGANITAIVAFDCCTPSRAEASGAKSALPSNGSAMGRI